MRTGQRFFVPPLRDPPLERRELLRELPPRPPLDRDPPLDDLRDPPREPLVLREPPDDLRDPPLVDFRLPPERDPPDDLRDPPDVFRDPPPLDLRDEPPRELLPDRDPPRPLADDERELRLPPRPPRLLPRPRDDPSPAPVISSPADSSIPPPASMSSSMRSSVSLSPRDMLWVPPLRQPLVATIVP